MSSPTPFEVKLIVKVTRAKMHLEDIKVQHRNRCPLESDTSRDSCNCGASKINLNIQCALDELNLEK